MVRCTPLQCSWACTACTVSLSCFFTLYNERGKAGGQSWATTISPSMQHISLFVFRQPWATTISLSLPPHLTLPGKTTFLNGIIRAFKVWFSKIQPRHAFLILILLIKISHFLYENHNLDLQKKSFAVYIKRNHPYFILTLKYKDLNIYLLL